LDNERFELEVYNPFKHKAMSTVERGSYIITKPQQPNVTKLADYASECVVFILFKTLLSCHYLIKKNKFCDF